MLRSGSATPAGAAVLVTVHTGSAGESIWHAMSCLACDLATGAQPLPGGLIHETSRWRVEHCIGPLGVGTLVVKPKRHVLRVAELDGVGRGGDGTNRPTRRDGCRRSHGRRAGLRLLWSHGPVHLHYVVQPVTADLVAEFGTYGPRMQAAMFARGDAVDPAAAAVFAQRARAWFAEHAG
jgi:hypothetical protein